MKILFVTSETTYIPGNYLDLLQELLEYQASNKNEGTQKWSLCAVVSVKTLDKNLIKTIIGLPLLGVFDLTKTLIRNIGELPFKKRSKLCARYKIPHMKVDSMNDESIINWVKQNDVDLILNLRTRSIYKRRILNAPNIGCVNIHHGLLPKYRGTFCDLYALSEGREAGFSLHKMEEKVDAGEIYKVVTVDKGSERNYRNYLKKTIKPEIETLINFFNECAKKKELPEGTPNTTSEKKYTKNPTRKTIYEFKERGLIL